jgi:hypothetical protein
MDDVKSCITVLCGLFALARTRSKVLKAHTYDVKNGRTRGASRFPA